MRKKTGLQCQILIQPWKEGAMSDTPAQDCFDEPCKHCGSIKGFWFSRSEPMGYFCEECGMPDNEELLDKPYVNPIQTL
jgi:hypothetical protein